MSQDRPVTLNYIGSTFGPVPKSVAVLGNDRILFRLGTSPVANGRLRITINDDRNFSDKVLQHGPGQNGREPLHVKVKPGFDTKTAYKCELLDAAGNVVTVSDGGGEIEPDSAGATEK